MDFKHRELYYERIRPVLSFLIFAVMLFSSISLTTGTFSQMTETKGDILKESRTNCNFLKILKYTF